MNTLQFITEFGIEELKNKYGIKVKHHKELPLVILNYDQLRSADKKETIVRECRQLIIDTSKLQIVGRSFKRFFNLNEDETETNELMSKLSSIDESQQENITFETKHDGSLIQLFWYNDRWMMATRGSFGDGSIDNTTNGPSWVHIVARWFPFLENLDMETNHLQKNTSYVFELCTEMNRVIRHYPSDSLYLLGAFEVTTGKEMSDEELNLVATRLSVLRPEVYTIASLEHAVKTIQLCSDEDEGFEGMIAKFSSKNEIIRVKIKSPKYVQLHHLVSHTMSWKTFVPVYLNNEIDEVRLYCSKSYLIDEYIKKIEALKTDILQEWEKYKHLQVGKELGLAIANHRFKPVFWSLAKSEMTSEFWKSQEMWFLKNEPK